MREAILGFVTLHFNCNVAEAFQLKYFLRFLVTVQGYEKKGAGRRVFLFRGTDGRMSFA
jgi:hypothetical protein